MPTIRLLIKGKVQGVFYRVSAKKAAVLLSILGWVRNLSDGTVECVASGTAEQLQKFESWCKKGPQEAEVKEVVITPIKDESFRSFEIR